MKTMLNKSVYRRENLTRDQTNHKKAMTKVRTIVEWPFGEIKSYNFFDFKSQLKINLSSVGEIY